MSMLAARAFAPDMLPTWLPRLVLLTLGAAVAAAALTAWLNGSSRRQRGGPWWRLALAPLDHSAAVRLLLAGALGPAAGRRAARRARRRWSWCGGTPSCWPTTSASPASASCCWPRTTWMRAATSSSRWWPSRGGAICVRRATTEAAEGRRAEVLDLSGVARDHLVGCGGRRRWRCPWRPNRTASTFAPDALLVRRDPPALRPAREPAAPDRRAGRTGGRADRAGLGRAGIAWPPCTDAAAAGGARPAGRVLQSSEGAVVRDAVRLGTREVPCLFTIQPAHNPVGPFDFGGGFDDGSDRAQPLGRAREPRVPGRVPPVHRANRRRRRKRGVEKRN